MSLFNNTNSSEAFGHSLTNSVSIAIASYFIFLIIGGVFFNIILIHGIFLKKRLRATSNLFLEQQHSTTNIFIINLAVCDLLTAIFTLPFEVDFLLRGHYAAGVFVCGLKETFFMFSLPASIVNLLLLTAERFVKLLFPFKHGNIFTKHNTVILMVVSWTYILLIALLPLMINKKAVTIHHGKCFLKLTYPYTIYQLLGNFLCPLICILVMNLALYWKVGKRAKAIKKHRRRARRCPELKSKLSNAIPLNLKAAKTIMMLVSIFLFCWLTFIIVVTVNIYCGDCLPREATWIVNAINYSSVALNPLLYGLLNRSIRGTLWKNYVKCRSNIERNYSTRLSSNTQFTRRKEHCTISSDPRTDSAVKKGRCLGDTVEASYIADNSYKRVNWLCRLFKWSHCSNKSISEPNEPMLDAHHLTNGASMNQDEQIITSGKETQF